MNTRDTQYALLKKCRIVFSAVLAAALFFSLAPAHAQQSTMPVGYVTLKAEAGTGTVKKITPISVPLYYTASDKSPLAGSITSLTATTLSDASAGWTAGQLSAVASPYLIKITSGAATGRTFLISTSTANTATTVTIDAKDAAQTNLTTVGIVAGNEYEIFRCFTLVELFGTPTTSGVLGGTSASAGDSLVMGANGVLETYFYSTTYGRWTKVAPGSIDATNTPVRPDSGILYSRLAATDLTVLVPGKVSTTNRMTMVKNSGTTILAQSWPVETTLLNLNIQQIPTWTANASVNSADKVKIVTNGVSVTYWFDGANWRKQTLDFPIGDGDSIPAGSAVILEQLGAQSGYSTLSQTKPYNVD
ncbi:MAG: hypothetical protein B9S32_08025 [Verrucomicrobia bacterium Tous-C9LFEB]|nr:MAG: hypothetical protein B9S32_08025 [Verrucomicrobia bacterium Tous-C9LFEB]